MHSYIRTALWGATLLVASGYLYLLFDVFSRVDKIIYASEKVIQAATLISSEATKQGIENALAAGQKAKETVAETAQHAGEAAKNVAGRVKDALPAIVIQARPLKPDEELPAPSMLTEPPESGQKPCERSIFPRWYGC